MAKNPLPGRLLLDVFRSLPSDEGLTVTQIVKYYSTKYEVPLQRAVIVVQRAIKSALRAGFMYKTNRRFKLGLQEKKGSRGSNRPQVEGQNLYGTEDYFVTELFEADEAQKKDDEKGGNVPKEGPGAGGGGGNGGIFPSGRGGGGTCIPGDSDNHSPNCPHSKHNSTKNKTEDDNENEQDDDDKNDETSTSKSDADSDNIRKRRTKRSSSETDEYASRRKTRRRRVMQPCCHHSPRRARRRTRR